MAGAASPKSGASLRSGKVVSWFISDSLDSTISDMISLLVADILVTISSTSSFISGELSMPSSSTRLLSLAVTTSSDSSSEDSTVIKKAIAENLKNYVNSVLDDLTSKK